MLQLYLRHDFYDIIFKTKHKLHVAPGSAAPLPNKKNSGCASDRIGDEMCIVLTGNVLDRKEAQLVKTRNGVYTAQSEEPLSWPRACRSTLTAQYAIPRQTRRSILTGVTWSGLRTSPRVCSSV